MFYVPDEAAAAWAAALCYDDTNTVRYDARSTGCWADLTPRSTTACGLMTASEIGLCPDHYEEITGRPYNEPNDL